MNHNKPNDCEHNQIFTISGGWGIVCEDCGRQWIFHSDTAAGYKEQPKFDKQSFTYWRNGQTVPSVGITVKEKHWPWPNIKYYNACQEPCDTVNGPCVCGAWHQNEFTIENGWLVRYGKSVDHRYEVRPGVWEHRVVNVQR